MRSIDLLLLMRPRAALDARVQESIRAQTGIRLHPHVVIGAPKGPEEHRWETISRARNQAKRLGDAPWVMFLDDDVVLGPTCVLRLSEALSQHPNCAALAADYLGEGGGLRAGHVAMGATLFRRTALEHITFRWDDGRCECQCCCDDLRRLGWIIGYCPQACAVHLNRRNVHGPATPCDASQSVGTAHSAATGSAAARAGRILAAFDSKHYDKFVRQFLQSLRASGNREVVTAVVYGLSPLEISWLRRLKGVDVVPRPKDGRAVPVRRVEDFREVLQTWHPETPVAYWDAGDVIFQTRLDALWRLVLTNRDKILAVRECRGHPENRAVASWTLSIRDPSSRRRAYELLTRRPFLNSGFAAGTARSLGQYFQEAERFRKSRVLAGTSDWGDQTALNLYCHSDPERWREIDEVWNYCLFARRRSEAPIDLQGRAVRYDGKIISVVHGSAGTLRFYPMHHTLC